MINASQLVESFRFWDVVALWARERLEHESLIARVLATGIIRDGLRFQSTEPSRTMLYDEFVRKEDFKTWLRATDQALPAFWYGEQNR